MIFVTTGTDPRGFERLVRRMDEIAGRIDEEVIMQIGGTEYAPRNAVHFGYTTQERIRDLCRAANVVVTLAGVGTILDALQQGTPVVVVPRLRQYGEVIDDHQVGLTRELEKAGKITAVYNLEGLEKAVARVDRNPLEFQTDRRLAIALRRHIAESDRS